MSKKKSLQLGMSFSTANGRLYKDIIFEFSQKLGYINCFRCGGPLTRDTFSVEHIKPWQDAPNAFELFFDITNISFSHLKCNSGSARKYHKKYNSPQEIYRAFKEKLQNDPERLRKFKEAREREKIARREKRKQLKGIANRTSAPEPP